MGKHTVHVPESTLASDRRRMTAAQWLTEFRVNAPSEGRTSVFRFAAPVRLTFDQGDGLPRHEEFKESPSLFRRLYALALADAVLISVRSEGWKLNAKGLFTLNHALRTPAVRKGGLNIVRHYFDTRSANKIPLRGDFDALLSYLEVRPILTRKTPKPTPQKNLKPTAS